MIHNVLVRYENFVIKLKNKQENEPSKNKIAFFKNKKKYKNGKCYFIT